MLLLVTASVSKDGTSSYAHAGLVNSVIGGIGAALLVGAALQQAATARRRQQAQTDADRQRRITESFSKAVEQLASEKIEMRFGGIYTLERISLESPFDYFTVMETLAAFVRERARWKKADAATGGDGSYGGAQLSVQHTTSYRHCCGAGCYHPPAANRPKP
jgi:hypothetical protein